MTTYYITCPGNTNYWERAKAKTLRGAKAEASRTWQATWDSKLIVAGQDEPGGQMYELAIKRGLERWVNA